MTLLLMQPAGTKTNASRDEVLAATETCVSCGLCLPHCPTYRLAASEAESPRGRISLVKGVLSGHLPADEKMLDHLDNCLLCRNCEKVCPAQVKYEQIIDGARSELREMGYQLHQNNNRLANLLSCIIRYRRRMRPVATFLALIQHSYIAWLASISRLPGIKVLGSMVEALPRFSLLPIFRKSFPVTGTCRGTVALFTGCVSEQGEKDVLQSAIRVLNRLGYNVLLPDKQSCCGVNDYHEGNQKAGDELVNNNLAAFSDKQIDAVISVDTGCGAMLRKYPISGLGLSQGVHELFPDRVFDIHDFIMTAEWPENMVDFEMPATVFLHETCSSQYAMRRPELSRQLLEKIPGIDLLETNGISTCCGASGSKSIVGNKMSAKLGSHVVQMIREKKPDYVLSANITCRTHLKNLADMRTTRFIHPVQLLDRYFSLVAAGRQS